MPPMSGGLMWLVADYKNIYDHRYKGLILMSECEPSILTNALNMYDSYITVRMCIKKMEKHTDHQLWLPIEIWQIIVDMIKCDVINHNIHSQKLVVPLRELEVYKKDIVKINHDKILTKAYYLWEDDKKLNKIINSCLHYYYLAQKLLSCK